MAAELKTNSMPGKSKKGGGLTSSPIYKMKSSPTKFYQELEMFNKYKKAKNLTKIGVKRAIGGATALATSAYELFKGYGNLAKQKHGKQIIKDSGVGRTRKA